MFENDKEIIEKTMNECVDSKLVGKIKRIIRKDGKSFGFIKVYFVDNHRKLPDVYFRMNGELDKYNNLENKFVKFVYRLDEKTGKGYADNIEVISDNECTITFDFKIKWVAKDKKLIYGKWIGGRFYNNKLADDRFIHVSDSCVKPEYDAIFRFSTDDEQDYLQNRVLIYYKDEVLIYYEENGTYAISIEIAEIKDVSGCKRKCFGNCIKYELFDDCSLCSNNEYDKWNYDKVNGIFAEKVLTDEEKGISILKLSDYNYKIFPTVISHSKVLIHDGCEVEEVVYKKDDTYIVTVNNDNKEYKLYKRIISNSEVEYEKLITGPSCPEYSDGRYLWKDYDGKCRVFGWNKEINYVESYEYEGMELNVENWNASMKKGRVEVYFRESKIGLLCIESSVEVYFHDGSKTGLFRTESSYYMFFNTSNSEIKEYSNVTVDPINKKIFMGLCRKFKQKELELYVIGDSVFDSEKKKYSVYSYPTSREYYGQKKIIDIRIQIFIENEIDSSLYSSAKKELEIDDLIKEVLKGFTIIIKSLALDGTEMIIKKYKDEEIIIYDFGMLETKGEGESRSLRFNVNEKNAILTVDHIEEEYEYEIECRGTEVWGQKTPSLIKRPWTEFQEYKDVELKDLIKEISTDNFHITLLE